MTQGKEMLVVSAYAANYIQHSGSTIARYIKNGADVHVVVLSFGAQGESNDLRKQEGATADNVREARRKETMEAVVILGIRDIEFWDLLDYSMAPALTPEVQERLIRKICGVRPNTVLAHDKNGEDVLNPDHNAVSQFVFECNIQDNSNDVRIEGTQTTKQMRLYGFEPYQTELSKFAPGSFTGITEAYEQKVATMKYFKTQDHLTKYYTGRAFLRGNRTRRISGNQTYKYAKCFSSFSPTTGEELY